MTRDAGEVIQTIPSNSLVVATATVSSEFGFEDLCSYNWQENGSIVVPGGPPKWVYQPLPITLLPDAGHQFVDQNAFRVPQFPFEPAFQALSIVKPEAKLDDIDIIVNRNSLRKLLDFAAGRRRDPWRMDLHLVKNTLFISRKEMSARAMVRGNGNSGYGHNFEKAFTKPEPGLDGSSSHHRVIRYRFGSLECAVRFEVDAYYEDPDLPDPTDPAQQSLDQIATTMAQLQINEPQPSTTKKGNTQVIVKGNPVDPAKLAEIKTRKQVNINDALPQLWFGRTPYLLTGRHENGVFGSISCSHVQLQFKAWETDNQEALRKMVTLLTDLKRIVQGMDRGAAILTVLDKGGPLQIFKMKNATGVLPKHMITKYWTFGSEG
ncbi:hypothetical protein P153DRAFT_301357 [Dothidotthia symphoricarpi CBS 119687]|uniref:RAI1-like domain-containing protein n=1 Tax=Dothidotthia symphoricarpi CBS 119687 TaxID=1392245 RepID=A0A6A6A0R6_9PLEO|nr:uncharacterized protein P153DRAFT_301357 [Dothidotthia symphoricarpi CBS 119687]KAF2124744.1 hypothetical protein P153DRAFT_301357 [Dothidotthia symphoricarpi CBS 119687]